MSIIALLTDFGSADWFVGTMKGVIAAIAPKAQVIDLCHDIPPGDVKAGAFALLAAYRYFPKGTIFVAVIDPGSGARAMPCWPRPMATISWARTTAFWPMPWPAVRPAPEVRAMPLPRR